MTGEHIAGFAEALEFIGQHAAHVSPRGDEVVSLRIALGRVLARDVVADRDFPPFARSTRDGYALAAGAKREFRVLGEVRAGESWTGERLSAGTCVAIMTGAPVPAGADAVVMLEHVSRSGDTVLLAESREAVPGQNVVAAGSEAAKGSMVLPAGVRLGPAQIGLAAACGCAELRVFTRPRVAVLATGDELVDVNETPGPEQIRNSNSYELAAAVERAGAEAVVLEVARDTEESLEQQLRLAFECDLVLLAGGVSAGKYDLAESVLASKFGAEFFFTGVRMQPGKPVVFGRAADGTYFFGLPGNPVSALVTFGLLARPMLAALCGERGWTANMVSARLEEDVQVQPGLTRFLPASITFSIEGATVRRVPWRGSGDMAALAASNGFLVVPDSSGLLKAGDSVTVWLD
jgi:molybdopterin molybdotransferase